MPGIFAGTAIENYMPINEAGSYEKGMITSCGICFARNTIPKFQNDKCLVETDDYVVVMEGYLLNKRMLLEKYKVKSVPDLAIKMYNELGEVFFGEFRGGFSGIFYDKVNGKLLAYTNQTGESALFYWHNADSFFIGTKVKYVLEAIKLQGVSRSFDENAAYQMLTYAFMVDDSTFIKEIKRLQAGHYICVTSGSFEVRRYHRFEHHFETTKDMSEDEIIKTIDRLFRTAVELEFAKDNEYSYEHLVDMSGGLDSRMTAWVAHTMGNKHLQLITYSRNNYLDELIAKEIAEYWNDELLFKSLDDVSFLRDIDTVVPMLDGLSIYAGITGGRRMLDSLNIRKYGLEHTGMIGDVVLGSFCRNANDLKNNLPTGRYSESLNAKYGKNAPWIEKNVADDHDLFLLYARGMQGAANTELLRQYYTCVSSPFMYLEFFQFCMDIPMDYRYGHNIYKKWIVKCYPEAAEFRWEKTGTRITDSKVKAFTTKVFRKGPEKIKSILRKDYIRRDNMNPLDYWYSRNEYIREALGTYYSIMMNRIRGSVSENLYSDLIELFTNGNVLEKCMVISVLGAFKAYFE